MKWSIGKKIGAGFAFALAILIVIGVISYRSILALMDSAGWVNHTYQVLQTLENLQGNLTKAESAERGYIITGDDSFLMDYQTPAAQAKEEINSVRQLTNDNPSQQQRLAGLAQLLDQRFTVLEEALNLRKTKGMQAAAALVQTSGRNTMEEINRVISDATGEENRLLAERADAEKARADSTETTILGGIALTFLALLVAGVWLSSNIASPLTKLTETAQRVSVGDLVVDFSVDGRRDEVGVLGRSIAGMAASLREFAEAADKIASGDLGAKIAPKSEKDILGKAFTTMRDNLRRMTSEIQGSVSVLSSSASEIVASSTQVAASASEAAAAVTETNMTVEQVKQGAQLSNEKARYVSDSALRAVEVSQAGTTSVEETIDEMRRIREQMESIAETIVTLSEQTQSIAEIVATVNDLADQSNILAVNAAIEAAKAGEQGKGFTVVAQEVRNLAEQSKQATAQARSLLGDVQKATSAAVMATEQGSKAVEAGVKQATEAGESVRNLAQSIMESAQAAREITASSQQQLLAMDQVAQAMSSIKDASVQNVAGTKQTETAAQDLRELGRKLKDTVAQFRG